MSWFEALILGILQGLTEYLPVSSSGHLAIGSALFGYFQCTPHQSSSRCLLFGIYFHDLWHSEKT